MILFETTRRFFNFVLIVFFVFSKSPFVWFYKGHSGINIIHINVKFKLQKVNFNHF